MTKLTIRDIARAAGVSTATVSRALRGMDNVDTRTREHVLAVARRLDYSVSPSASRLATGRSGTIGIVTPFVGRWYFTELFAGIEAALAPHDLDLLIHTTEEPAGTVPVTEAHVRLRRRVDGAIVIGLGPGSRELAHLAASGIPLVLVGAEVAGITSVAIDDRAAAAVAVSHLADLGHRRIGLISGRPLPTPFLPENDRLAGYLDVLRARRLPHPRTHRRVGGFTVSGGARAMAGLLDVEPRVTAVFSMSDEMAYGALHVMRRAGVRASGARDAGDIAVVGFDGHDLADVFDLTTVEQPVRRLGKLAMELLMRQLQGDRPSSIVVPTTLRVRASTDGNVANE
ncbi:transcriptional regulator, LacI family [Jatrophihabitans endophyticus]|uniref:Transcriptional regulator, LacI family n=1 Tax=Jatrophihabitans endophyticus TaxID=1206085 RepID=A0A1M5S693_9ACTN|nr:LacI family DNA-binding transcriptional regulator [Jatrophihabitans endophyticus]SHH33453.1 transcriptional regulator, LacI family [Jatrophihabitans endophyticus]